MFDHSAHVGEAWRGPQGQASSELTHDQATAYEIALIAAIGRVDLGTGPLANLTAGGEGVSIRLLRPAPRCARRIARLGLSRTAIGSCPPRSALSSARRGRKAWAKPRDARQDGGGGPQSGRLLRVPRQDRGSGIAGGSLLRRRAPRSARRIGNRSPETRAKMLRLPGGRVASPRDARQDGVRRTGRFRPLARGAIAGGSLLRRPAPRWRRPHRGQVHSPRRRAKIGEANRRRAAVP